MNNKFGPTLRFARKAYHALPLGVLRKAIYPLSKRLRNAEVGNIYTQTIKGVTLELDLGELIDYEIYREGCFEKETHDRLNELISPGMTILDIGANVGAHTFFMAQKTGPNGHVYAFEPASYAFRKLSNNANLNPSLKVSLINAGLSSTPQRNVKCTTFSSWRIDDSSKAGTIDHSVMKNAKGREDNIDLIPLDHWIQEHKIPKISLIKLDIDGNELDFFNGATLTLAEHKPIILFEWAEGILNDRGYSGTDLLTILDRLGYRFEFENGEKTDIPSATKAIQAGYKNNPIHSVNLIAFPKE